MSRYRSHTYSADQIRRFFEAVDLYLAARTRIELIGGGAAALAHGAVSTTTDLDTFNVVDSALLDAVARANEETGYKIPLSQSTVADVPYDYAERLERQLPDLRWLEVWVLERHDLVLSKSVRCYEHDVQQIVEMHARTPLSFEVLVERFASEMTGAIGDRRRLRSNILLVIEELFGELSRVTAERRLKSWC